MQKSKIEWTDATWNPVTGCTRVSAGCDNCYAAPLTKRLASMGQEKYQGLYGKGHFNGKVRCHEDALKKPFEWKKPRMVFVNSMSDLFHRDVPFGFIDQVFAVMSLCPKHIFQILTKRPDRMFEYFDRYSHYPAGLEMRWGEEAASFIQYATGHVDFSDNGILPNVWLGTSVENQATADERIPHLLSCPAGVRFLSCEPLLEPVDLRERLTIKAVGCMSGFSSDGKQLINESNTIRIPGIHWVIVGGESGPGARPMDPDWARSIRDQCVDASVPFFFKQWGGVNKRKAGRILDGRPWDEFPKATTFPEEA
ncbi:MAG: phage Gp37/Gp68 family protein [Phycisphaerales bacterium]|nr:phage Gp37/Gp68 family protein [Phycisphaerales bacterium]